jgi:hypothetical protein
MNLNHATRPFLLVECGPLFNIETRIGLIRKNAHQTARRAFLAALFAWFPLLVLSGLQGVAYGSSVLVPFLADFSAWSRFLLAIPLLVLAENILGPRIANAAEQFVTSGVVDRKDYQQFDRIIEQGLRSRDSKAAEIVIALLAYLVAITGFRLTASNASTWYATQAHGTESLTLAGWWLIGYSAPLLHFLMLRWLWRLFVWLQFLGRVRNLGLNLFPTHPDKAAGLGFVGRTQRFFGILLFAISIGVAGVLANEIVYEKYPLRQFTPAIATYVIVGVAVVISPLAVFFMTLRRAKCRGLNEYGTLATSYTGSFHQKWILGKNPVDEPLLGTGDIQSLADLGNSYVFIERMYAVPVDPRVIIQLVIASVLPMTPLLLSVMPLGEIVKLLFKFLV